MKIIRAWIVFLVMLPPVLLAQQDPDIERGFKPGQSYQGFGNIDTVNLFNGTVNFTVPLKEYFVGGTLGYGFAVHGATNSWDSGTHAESEDVEFGYTYPWKHGQAGLGWILSLGKIAIDPDTGDLVYVDANGTQHSLYGTLHASNPAEQAQTGILYTRDGTYLRVKTLSDRYELNFPNGHLHTFDKTTGRLKQMQDPFANYVAVLYGAQTTSDPFPGSTLWTITDSVGRTHKVYFRPGPNYAEHDADTTMQHELVYRVDLAAFNGAAAQYQFTYENELNNTFSQVSRRCAKKNDPDMQVVNVALLTSVKLDGYIEYSFDYEKGNQATCSQVSQDGASGNLKRITLPTGGTIDYTFRKYFFPGSGGGQSRNAGVATRTVKNHNGAILSETTYLPELLPPNAIDYDVVRTVTEKDASFKTKHYFGACRRFAVYPPTCQTAGYYGLPVTTSQNLGGAYLSTEVLENQGGTFVTKRRTYRKYDADYYLDSGTQQAEMNQRPSFEKVVYEDGSWTSTTSTDFDGLSHYRTVATTGSWGPQNSRTAFTNFNPNNGSYTVNASHQLITSFTLPSTSGSWLLTTFDKERVTESSMGSAVQISESAVCFDSLGFLTSRRTYKAFGAAPAAASADLLARFTHDASGNLVKEQYVGGDTGVSAPTSWICGSTLSSEAYRIDHAYQYGVRARSYDHDGSSPFSFFLMDRDIDSNTGLVKRSRGVSTATSNGTSNQDGLATDYTFDLLDRLTDVLPQGTGRGAKTKFVYTMNPPTVVVSEIDGSTTLRSATTNFDSLGRVVSETRTMPTGTATHSVDYDTIGRKTTERNWGAAVPMTFNYDIFGRPTTVTAPADTTTPGGTATTIEYTGASKVERKVNVRTGLPGATPQYTEAKTTEQYDPLGRLWRVTEPPAIVGGTPPVTEYTYDVGGRLIIVCGNKDLNSSTCGQTRAFSYDNRGFLLFETHPEKGANGGGSTQYAEYDARGHAHRRYEGATSSPSFDVKFDFDRAERLTRVFTNQTSSRTLKRFFFGTSNVATDMRNGRLVQAVGYNWLDSAGLVVKVVEDYKYEQPDGLVSSRTTADYICAINSGACDPVTSGTKDREFIESFSYDKLGLPATLSYPDCTLSPCASSPRTITNTYSAGWLTGVTWSGAASSSTIAYAPQGTVSQVTHGNGVVDTVTLDVGGRLQSLTTSNALEQSSCLAPSFGTQPQSQTIAAGSTATLTASAAGETGHTITYQWYRGAVGDTSSPEGSPNTSGSLQVTLSATTSLWVRASNDCNPGTANSAGATITVCTAPTVAFPPESRTITRGQSNELLVIPAGSTPRTFQWYTVSGTVATPINGATSDSFMVSPTPTTTYRVKITNDCGYVTTDVTITVADPPTAPASVTATKEGSSIRINWSASASTVGIDYYLVSRLPDGAPFSQSGGSTTFLNSTALVAGNAYAYRVYAVDTNGIASEPSAYDLATLLAFTDDPVTTATQTVIKGIHVGQLREAIDAVRRAANLPRAWQSYAAAAGAVYAGDFLAMRDRLNEARAVLQLPLIGFLPAVTVGSPIYALQLQQLRGGVQ